MRIRSITIFDGEPLEPIEQRVARAGALANTIRKHLNGLGYEVQTTRVAFPPIHEWAIPNTLLAIARRFDESVGASGIDYISLGPISCDASSGDIEMLQILPGIIAATRNVFASAFITGMDGTLLTGTMPFIAATIKEIAKSTENGFGNLRFAALANCAAGIPFFPAAYAKKGEISFALATEAASLAVEACHNADSTNGAMEALQHAIETHAHKIEPAMLAVAHESKSNFLGIDWSLATHPDEACSIGAALEALSGAPVGQWGTLTAVAALTRAIKRAAVRKTGFCGVFLPVMEDAVLARRTEKGSCDLPRLLLYSAVCGTGLDTIPLPGDVSTESISALLADVATLSVVLDKPMTVRLMPIPGLQPGEKTRFDFPYLVNTGALDLNGAAKKLMRDSSISLKI